jgi:hypothetical protein
MVFVLTHPHFDWTRNTHLRLLFPANLSEYHGAVIDCFPEAEFSRRARCQAGKEFCRLLSVWLKICSNTTACGEQSGKMAMSPIRQRFVPALISAER